MDVTKVTKTFVAVDAVVVNVRRRVKTSNLRSLQRSIELRGLLHPILLRNGNELVAGARRLAAVKGLGWKKIPAFHVDDLSDDELRAVEVEENTARESLTESELSSQRSAVLRQAHAKLESEAQQKGNKTTESVKKSPHRKTGTSRGRPKGSKKAASREAVAEETGISRATQVRIEQREALKKQYAFLRRDGYSENGTLKCGELLDQLTAGERQEMAAMLDQDGIIPDKVPRYLQNVVEMSDQRRSKMFELWNSDDLRLKQAALTMASGLRVEDYGFRSLQAACRELDGAVEQWKHEEFADRLGQLWQAAKALRDEVNNYRKGLDE